MRVLKHYVSPQLVALAVIEFALAIGSYLLCAFVLSDSVTGFVPGAARGAAVRSLVFALVVIVGVATMGLYSWHQRLRLEDVIARLLIGLGGAATGMAVLNLFFQILHSRVQWLASFAICFLVIAIARVVFQVALEGSRFQRSVLIFGAGKRASSILQLRRQSDQRGFKVVAFVPAPGDTMTIEDDRVVLQNESSLFELAQELRADEVVVAADDRRAGFPVNDLLQCKLSGINVSDVLGFLERETGRVKVNLMNPSWLIFSEGFSRTGASRIAFRILDVCVAIAILILAWPFMLLAALAIAIDDGFPVLYRQRRVGISGKNFTLYKFRSMKKDAESEGVAVWAATGDDRITRVGRFLRKTRLDELPQLLNVLRDEMSFVGPRPERPEFVEQLAKEIPYYHERHYVKPGLTGWAQLCYPYGSSKDAALAKLEFDLYYIKNRSLVFNIIILLQTVEVVLWQKGSR